MFLAVARVPPGADGAALVARALGVARAEVAHRLAGVLPRAVVFEATPERLTQAAATLAGEGVVAFVIDPATVATDGERIIGRTLTFGAEPMSPQASSAPPGRVTVLDRSGAPTVLGPGSVELIQRGFREHVSTQTHETKERKLSMGRAVLTGGLSMTRTETRQHTTTETHRQAFVVLHRRAPEPEVVLYERGLDYRFVEPRPQPASAANFAWTLARLRQRIPEAAFDERLLRPGFLNGPLAALADGTDLAMAMVREAVRRGC